MGAGRRTETYTMAPDSHYSYGTMCGRNLKKGDLCGVVFGCKFSTIKECYAKKLFGLPTAHMAYIQNIDPGLTLFLFNYSDRTLHGIFEAASEGKLNIDPKAWSPNGTDPSPYPAQVKVRVRVQCEPLVEEKFRPVIAENYNDEKMFWFELDRGQTNKLLRLFKPSPSARAPSTSKEAAPPSRKPIPASFLVEIGDKGAPRVDKWSSLFKSSKDSSENKGKTGGWEVAANNADERKAQPSMSKSGASYSSVLRNIADSLTLEKKTSLTYEVPSQASEGVKHPWSAASQVLSLYQDSREFGNASKEGEDVKENTYDQQILHPTQNKTSAAADNRISPSKEDSAEDTCSEIDWDASSSFKVHLDRLNGILEDHRDKDDFKRFEGNMGFASSSSSSSIMPNHWEDMKVPWNFEEGNIEKSPCGSSYVSTMTGDALENIGEDNEKHGMNRFNMEMGSSTVLDILEEILSEVKELKLTQMRQTQYIINLEMELIESKKEILQLKRRYASS